jgi:hypothetical protein
MSTAANARVNGAVNELCPNLSGNWLLRHADLTPAIAKRDCQRLKKWACLTTSPATLLAGGGGRA